MNEVQAREIVKVRDGFILEKDKPYTLDKIIHEVMQRTNTIAKADGYLEAREKARGLEEALEDESLQPLPYILKEALAKFREAI